MKNGTENKRNQLLSVQTYSDDESHVNIVLTLKGWEPVMCSTFQQRLNVALTVQGYLSNLLFFLRYKCLPTTSCRKMTPVLTWLPFG